jgi:hypothetical protein
VRETRAPSRNAQMRTADMALLCRLPSALSLNSNGVKELHQKLILRIILSPGNALDLRYEISYSSHGTFKLRAIMWVCVGLVCVGLATHAINNNMPRSPRPEGPMPVHATIVMTSHVPHTH